MRRMMKRQLDALKKLRLGQGHRMDRHLYIYVKHRLSRPEALDALSLAMLERLRRTPERQLARSPLRWFFAIAACTLRKRQAAGLDTATIRNLPCSTSDDDGLGQHLQIALAQLPTTHGAVLIARNRGRLSFTEIGERLGLPSELVTTYYTQAAALIRCTSWNPQLRSTATTPTCDDTLLVAQAAVDWLNRVDTPTNERIELAGWLARSPCNVRELLLACAWDLTFLNLESAIYDEVFG